MALAAKIPFRHPYAAGTSTYIMRQSTEYAAGQVSELLMYSSDLTAQRELIEGNIAWSYT